MADDFDSTLGRLFSQPPAFSDSDAFALRVTSRLDRNWAMRRLMIGIGGLAAGMVFAWQFLAGRFGGELAAVSHDTRVALESSFARSMAGFDQMLALPAGSETLWFAAAMAAAALAFAVTRAVESY